MTEQFKGGECFESGELLVKHKGCQLKFHIYNEGEEDLSNSEYLDVAEARRLRDYLDRVLPGNPFEIGTEAVLTLKKIDLRDNPFRGPNQPYAEVSVEVKSVEGSVQFTTWSPEVKDTLTLAGVVLRKQPKEQGT